jgi:hypothetical protein
MSEDMARAIDALEDGGMVIAAPGQEVEVFNQPRRVTFQALGGKIEFDHLVEHGFPHPAESDTAIAEYVGPGAMPVLEDLILVWTIRLAPRDKELSLARFTRIRVEDITSDAPDLICDAAPNIRDGSLHITAGGTTLTSITYPWMFESEPNTLVLRITLSSDDGSEEVLLQPVAVKASFKMQAQELLVEVEKAALAN